jgi:hypothetical protein
MRGQLICSPAAKQCGCICDIFTRGNLQPNDLECGAALQPVEERRPRLTVTVDTADMDRGRDIEHQHVLSMVRDGAIDIQTAYRCRPILDQIADFRVCARWLLGVIASFSSWLQIDCGSVAAIHVEGH